MQAYEHQDMPFDKLVDELHPDRILNQNPVFQVMFSMQNKSIPAIRLPGLQASVVEDNIGLSHFDMTFELVEGSHPLKGKVTYRTDLFKEKTIARLVKHFQAIAKKVVVEPWCLINTISLVTPKEQALHHLFSIHAQKTPQETAVSDGYVILDYRTLNERTNQLAHYLIDKGIAPGRSIALSLERSVDMIVAILATLKTGNSYVPIDVDYPEARQQYKTWGLKVKTILTDNGLEYIR